MVHADPDAKREDLLLMLLSLVGDPIQMAKTERQWLRDAEPVLAFDSPSNVVAGRRRTAEQAYRLLFRTAP